MNIDPSDRDLIIRTVMGEANGEPDAGQGAVAHVILNRLNSGKYGTTIPDILFAPKQFEPWSTRPRELLGYSAESPEYKRAARVVDRVVAGTDPDPTSGALNFLNEDVARERRGGSLPPWAKGNRTVIGQHAFYGPEEDLLGTFSAARKAAPATPAPAPEGDDLLSTFAPVAGERAKTQITVRPGNVVRPPQYTTDETGREVAIPWQQQDQTSNPDKTAWDKTKELASDVGTAIVKDFEGGQALARSGKEDWAAGRMLPSFPALDPSTWSGGGILKTAGGALGQLLSPLTGSTRVMVTDPIDKATGVPGTGEKAMMALGLRYPVVGTAKAANAMRPVVRAENALIDTIGAENLPGVIQRMESNPRLTLADASPSVRIATQGMIDPAQPIATSVINRAVKARMDSAKDAVTAAYDEAAGGTPNLFNKMQELKQAARTVGQKEIQPALEAAGPVDTTDLLKYMDAKIKPGLQSVASIESGIPSAPIIERLKDIRAHLATDSERLTDAQRLHTIQSALRAEAETLSKSANGPDRLLAAELRRVRNKIVDAIDDATFDKSGKTTYKAALGKYADEMAIEDAFEKGRGVLSNRMADMETHPDFWRNWVKNAKPEELNAAREGARSAIDHQINGMRFAARRGTDVPEIEYNRQKLEMLFGKQETDKLVKALKDEKDIAETNARVLHNSKTAETLAGQKAMAIRDVAKGPGHLTTAVSMLPAAADLLLPTPGIGSAISGTLLGSRAVGNVASRLGRRSDIARNQNFARAAMATGEERNALIQMLRGELVRRNPIGTGNKLMNLSTSPLLQLMPR